MAAYTTAVYLTGVGLGKERNYLPVASEEQSQGEKVAAPMSKKILAADTRMAKELAKIGLNAEEIQQIKNQRDVELKEKAIQKEKKELERKERVMKKELRQREKAEKEQKLEEDRRVTAALRAKLIAECPSSYAPHPAEVALAGEEMSSSSMAPANKPKRKPPNGPMTEALQKFISQKKSEGLTYWGAMAAWKTSSEREAIVSAMGPEERKRRKYD